MKWQQAPPPRGDDACLNLHWTGQGPSVERSPTCPLTLSRRLLASLPCPASRSSCPTIAPAEASSPSSAPATRSCTAEAADGTAVGSVRAPGGSGVLPAGPANPRSLMCSKMTGREQLNNRRASTTFDLEVVGLKYTATVRDFQMIGSRKFSWPTRNHHRNRM